MLLTLEHYFQYLLTVLAFSFWKRSRWTWYLLLFEILYQYSYIYIFTEFGLLFELMQHKSPIVNEELWREAQTYGDVQLMPFVDYYSLITWKTLAICIFGVMSCLFLWFGESFLRLIHMIPATDTSFGKVCHEDGWWCVCPGRWSSRLFA